MKCSGKSGNPCGALMALKARNGKGKILPYWRFGIKKSRVMRPQRSMNRFFYLFHNNGNANSNIAVCVVMRLLYSSSCTSSTVSERVTMCGYARQTIMDWDSVF